MSKGERKYLVGGALGAAVALLVYREYRKQKRQAIARLCAGSQIANTKYGPIECALLGKGPAILFFHGGGDGYDFGQAFTWLGWGYQIVSPSRPGYLRTPIEVGRSPDEQADAFAGLLDTLGIHSAAVVGASAGGPPALQFALRYPERCWGLALISAVNQPVPSFPRMMQSVLKVAPYVDFVPWLVLNSAFMWVLDFFMGSKLRSPTAGDPIKRALLDSLLRSMFPISLRLQGLVNDLTWCKNLPPIPLENVTIPTLVIHGDSDTIVPFTHGQASAARIPGAEALLIPGGDHLCFVTHLERTRPALLDFLDRHAPEETSG